MPSEANQNTNPCGMCRAMGSSVCKGHGGSSAVNDNPSESEKIPTIANQPNAAELKDLNSFLEKSPSWEMQDDFLFSFEGFNEHSAISAIKLDLGKAQLKLEPKEGLDPESKKDLNVLSEQIKSKATEFGAKPDNIASKNGSLAIKLSSPKQLDALVTDLIQQNLLPADNKGMQANLDDRDATSQINPEPDSKWNPPNPFDISEGPKPSDS